MAALKMVRFGKFRWVFGAAAALAFTACGNSFTTEQPGEVTVQIEGTVTASDTGNPIEGALVEVRTLEFQVLEVLTDSQGFYTLSYIYRFFRSEPFCPFIINYSADFFGSGLEIPLCLNDVETIDVQLARS